MQLLCDAAKLLEPVDNLLQDVHGGGQEQPNDPVIIRFRAEKALRLVDAYAHQIINRALK